MIKSMYETLLKVVPLLTLFGASPNLYQAIADQEKQEVGKSIRGVKVTLIIVSPPTGKILPLKPIVLGVEAENFSKEDQPWVETSPELDWQLEVKDSAGRPVPYTKLGNSILNPKHGHHSFRRRVFNLNPGQKVTYSITVNSYYDMTAPGVYTIRARQSEISSMGYIKNLALSNTVRVEVLPIQAAHK